ncbi:DUF2271 domain-containing protein [Flagellatimonas centrodinii]|uniref:DUF2271 domain-containing protein n=1 Tax=Flagellatimonas centrodinii TaxID=2806210 RepID=UPI001FF98C66|nr:DUF2271 domain-containing protein [Flagellatimonas centrodinii]ULQ47020.1 DUF2271 domain-containing protein [Flagellatimonas centrodinii]
MRLILLFLTVVALPLHAAELALDIELPRLSVAEYHRPYVAIWLEPEDSRSATSLAVWYDLKMPNREGEKWLKDLRQWWRRDGRSLTMPADAISSATRAPGHHRLMLDGETPPFATLPAGPYVLQVEVAREVGGREVIRLPFEWPPNTPSEHRDAGSAELGTVVLRLTP